MVMATSVMDVMKRGNTVPRAGIELISLTFQASVLPLYHVGEIFVVCCCFKS